MFRSVTERGRKRPSRLRTKRHARPKMLGKRTNHHSIHPEKLEGCRALNRLPIQEQPHSRNRHSPGRQAAHKRPTPRTGSLMRSVCDAAGTRKQAAEWKMADRRRWTWSGNLIDTAILRQEGQISGGRRFIRKGGNLRIQQVGRREGEILHARRRGMDHVNICARLESLRYKKNGTASLQKNIGRPERFRGRHKLAYSRLTKVPSRNFRATPVILCT